MKTQLLGWPCGASKSSILSFAGVLGALLLMVIVASPGHAGVVTIDGKVNGANEYDSVRTLNFTLDGGAKVQGELWQTVSVIDRFLHIGLVMPRSLVDTTYGQKNGPVDNSVDWWEYDKRAGEFKTDSEGNRVAKTHKSKDLTGSDKAQFQIFGKDKSVALDFTLDFAEGFDMYDGNKVNRDVGPFISGLADGDGNLLHDAAIETGPQSAVVEASSSMVYNYVNNVVEHPEFFNQDTSGDGRWEENKDYEGYSPDTKWDGSAIDYTDSDEVAAAYALEDILVGNTDWVFDMSYEVTIDMDALGADWQLGYVDVISGHVSPFKQGFDFNPTEGETFDFPGDPSTDVPEPASLLLMGLGALGLFGFARRRRR